MQPTNSEQKLFVTISGNKKRHNRRSWLECDDKLNVKSRSDYFKYPYQVGQKIFVKESFVKFQPIHYMRYPSGASFSEVFDGEIAYFADGYGTVAEFKKHYMACNNINELAQFNGLEAVETDGDRWKPAQHMKQEHSRLTLQIKEISVERLQNISEDDAIAEGVVYPNTPVCCHRYQTHCCGDYEAENASWEFKQLWNSTHKKPEEKFEANPFVWSIQFEVEK